jgi:two-component system, chemotaxis family, sensor kinase CheA
VTGGNVFEPLLDEYFAECEEHLAAIRRALLALEGGAAPARELRDIARALHTLKGLSGMVGFGEIERVAHALEDRLRAAGGAALPAAALEALFAGALLLERCLGARRAGGEPVEIASEFAQLPAAAAAADDVSVRPLAAAADRAPEEVRAAAAAGERVLRFAFSPARELVQRGVGVETIRARLSAAGRIIETRPRVVDGGRVVFEFFVAVPPGFTPPEPWRAEGLGWSVAAEPAPAGEAPAERRPVPQPAPSVVRVELSRLDELMRLVGELVSGRARLDDALRTFTFEGAAAAWESLNDVNGSFERQLRELREAVMRVRLVPIGEAFERMRFAIREIAREQGRQVSVQLEGGATEMDKLLVERMHEPLLHLVRNAVSHGIETPARRAAAGKPAEGRVTLRAASVGERIVIEVADDGAGIDAALVIEKGRAQGLVPADADASAVDLLELLCAPGFSTRADADLASGRGIGMAVVHSTVRELGGELQLDTVLGRGTCYRVELPLTLMIVDALLVEIAGERMAVPQPALLEVLQVEAGAITRFENNEVLMYRGGVLPLLRLRDAFGLSGAGERRALHVLVIGTAAEPIGLLVDRIAGLREIVVRPLADPLVAVPGIAGATELSDGRLVLILDTTRLARLARERGAGRVRAALAAAEQGRRPA